MDISHTHITPYFVLNPTGSGTFLVAGGGLFIAGHLRCEVLCTSPYGLPYAHLITITSQLTHMEHVYSVLSSFSCLLA